MGQKNIILIGIIVFLFVASGAVLYTGIFKSKTDSGGVSLEEKPKIENLLPYGTKFDTGEIKSRAATAVKVDYGAVGVAEVGVDIHSLIIPATDAVPAQVNVVVQRGQTVQ